MDCLRRCLSSTCDGGWNVNGVVGNRQVFFCQPCCGLLGVANGEANTRRPRVTRESNSMRQNGGHIFEGAVGSRLARGGQKIDTLPKILVPGMHGNPPVPLFLSF